MPNLVQKFIGRMARKALEFSLQDEWGVERVSRIRGTINNSPINYSSVIGSVWQNSAVRACMQSWESAFTQSGIEVVTGDKAKPEVVNSPLSSLIEYGNPYYDGSVLKMATLASLLSDGNAYWFPKKNRLTREVRELYFIPHQFVEPDNDNNPRKLITRYKYSVNGKTEYRDPDEVIHLRIGVDPVNQRKGYGYLRSVLEEIYSDNEMTLYTAALLTNGGAVSFIVSYDGDATPFDPDTLKKMIVNKTTGGHRGEPLVLDFPAQVANGAFSPEQLMIDKMRNVPEARIAAVMGVPAMVAGLSVGEAQRTYANYEEARKAFLEDSVLPLMQIIAQQLTRQLLPWVSVNSEKERVRFDTSMFRALRPDLDSRDARIRENYRAGLIDRYTALTQMELETTDADRGVFFTSRAVSEPLPTAERGVNENAR